MGYAPEQVDEFRASLANEWTRLVNEVQNTESLNRSLTAEIKECRRREHSLHDSLQLAKQVADDVRQKAEEEAQDILSQAKSDAKLIVADAEKRRAELLDEINQLEQQRIAFENRMRGVLQRHLDLLDDITHKDAPPIESSIPAHDLKNDTQTSSPLPLETAEDSTTDGDEEDKNSSKQDNPRRIRLEKKPKEEVVDTSEEEAPKKKTRTTRKRTSSQSEPGKTQKVSVKRRSSKSTKNTEESEITKENTLSEDEN